MAPYLTADQVRDRVPSLADPQDVPDDTIVRHVAEFAGIAERYRGVAFGAATVTSVVYPAGGVLLLPSYPVTSITTVDGAATDARFDASGVVHGAWPCGTPVTVVYVAGVPLPEELLRACAEYVRCVVEQTFAGTSRDVIAQTIDGTVTRYSTPSWEQGRPTGYLEVDRLLNSLPDYRIPGIG